MYYENKSTFYVKQYGTVAIISIVSILLISIGGYIFFKSSGFDLLKEKFPQVAEFISKTENKKVEEQPVNNTEIVEENKKVEEPKKVEQTIVLQKNEGKFKTINEQGIITANVEGKDINFALIGIDNITSEAVNKIKSDIDNKTIKIAYDKQKEENNITYVYLYIDDKLYNSELLKTGLVTLRVERNNVELLGELLNAQNYARENRLGVFK